MEARGCEWPDGCNRGGFRTVLQDGVERYLCLRHAGAVWNARKAANRAAGLCACGAEPDPGYRTCARCRERARFDRRIARAFNVRAAECGIELPRANGRRRAWQPCRTPLMLRQGRIESGEIRRSAASSMATSSAPGARNRHSFRPGEFGSRGYASRADQGGLRYAGRGRGDALVSSRDVGTSSTSGTAALSAPSCGAVNTAVLPSLAGGFRIACEGRAARRNPGVRVPAPAGAA